MLAVLFAAGTFGIALGGAGGNGWIGASKTGGFNFSRTLVHARCKSRCKRTDWVLLHKSLTKMEAYLT